MSKIRNLLSPAYTADSFLDRIRIESAVFVADVDAIGRAKARATLRAAIAILNERLGRIDTVPEVPTSRYVRVIRIAAPQTSVVAPVRAAAPAPETGAVPARAIVTDRRPLVRATDARPVTRAHRPNGSLPARSGAIVPEAGSAIEIIVSFVAEAYSVDPESLRAQNRRFPMVSQARHLAMFLARQLTRYSLMDIARRFAVSDHTTVAFAVQKIESLIERGGLAIDLPALEEDLVARLATATDRAYLLRKAVTPEITR